MASSSTSSLITTPSKFTGQVRQLNESVFELHKPSGKPKMQIVFFHGFQLGGYENAHLSTWTSRDDSCVWPQTWLVEEFPHAHIFSLAYNARLTKSKEYGVLDLHNIGENIVSDLFEVNIGQDPRCPLIVVGHSFGGIVIKQLCLHAREKGLSQHNNFLQNLKGVFFYSTPHHGAEFEKFAPRIMQRSPLLENVKILSTSAARLHHGFENLRKVHYQHWQVEGVGESQPTQWGPFSACILVQEASSRYGENFGIVEDADHMTVCRPKAKTSRAFNALTNLLKHIYSNSKVFGPVHQSRGLPYHPSGLVDRVTKAKRILENASVLGIVGMGGLGKSVIAKQLFNDVSIQFECTCFVDNVKGISIDVLNEKVLNGFYQHGSKVEKGQMKWDKLMEKKTLIVMDDVDDTKHLRELPKLDELGNGSRLVFTSRKHDIFSIYGKDAECYQVEFLEDEEATKLLCLHAFDAEKIPNNLEYKLLGKYINVVVKKCGGLPLTLEVIGSYLRPRCHEVEFWKETTRKLGEARPISGDKNDEVWASLRLSYDSLAQEEQEIFIDAATCLFEQPLEDALETWSSTKGGVHTSWNNLINRSLVKEVSKKRLRDQTHWMEYTGIWVHEHLRDLAKKISRRQDCKCDVTAFEKSIGGEVISVVSGPPRQLHFWQRMPPRQLHFWQRMTEGSSSTEANKEEDENVLPVRRLRLAEALRNLKYLRLDFPTLPKGLNKTFPKNLCLLECCGVILGRRPNDFTWKGMNKLRVLRVWSSTIGMNFGYTLGKLVNLRILSLNHLDGFTSVPKDFGNLSSLNWLELRNLDVAKLPDSFGDLRALEHLILDELQILKLPESFGGLHSLQTLLIRCSKFEELPGSFGQLKALKMLTICHGNLKALPESFGLLCCLEKLILDRCFDLQRLSNDFGQLVGLKTLKLSCPKLENLPSNFGLLCGLEYLSLIGCRHLQRLPNTFGQLTTLKKLTISEASDLQDLCENFGLLTGLEELELDLGSNGVIQTLITNSEKLTMLKKLTLTIAEDEPLQELCDNAAGHFSGVGWVQLNLEGFQSTRLPDNFGRLTMLTILVIDYAAELEELPDSIGQISSLKKIALYDCHGLKSLPNSLGKPLSPQRALSRGDEASPSRTTTEGSDGLGKAVWHGVHCEGCKMKPIEGNRFISKKRDYDLCSNCFGKALNENTINQVDFVRSCQPPEPSSMELRIRECCLTNSVLKSLGWVTKPSLKQEEFHRYQRIRLDEE